MKNTVTFRVVPIFVCVFSALAQAQQTASPVANAGGLKHEIEQLQSLLPTLPDRGAALFVTAQDHARLGNVGEAMSWLKQCVSLDEGFDPKDDPAFAALRGDPEFQLLVERVHHRYRPVHRARVVFTINEKDLIPEGLAIDQRTGDLYMSSLNRRKIVKIDKNGQVSDFIHEAQDNIGPVCGIKVEKADQSVWANVCRDDGKSAELLHFDKSGRLSERFTPPTSGPHLFNDLVLHDGEVYLTDSLANRVYKFNRQLHRFSEIPLAREVYYPNGIALSDDGKLLYVADAFGILLVDLRHGGSREVIGQSATLSGADGLYWYRNILMAVQNSLGSARVAQFRLSPKGDQVTEVRTLEYRSPLVASPTTGAIDGRSFYFISNTQLENFKDDKILDPNKLEPIRISVLELQPRPN